MSQRRWDTFLGQQIVSIFGPMPTSLQGICLKLVSAYTDSVRYINRATKINEMARLATYGTFVLIYSSKASHCYSLILRDLINYVSKELRTLPLYNRKSIFSYCDKDKLNKNRWPILKCFQNYFIELNVSTRFMD